MEPNEAERRDLSERVTTERIRRYRTRINAYVAAGINSSTWTKVEKGEPVSERSLIAVVSHLWPETDGDWRKLVPPLGQGGGFRDAVLSANISDEARAAILQILDSEQERSEPPAGERGAS